MWPPLQKTFLKSDEHYTVIIQKTRNDFFGSQNASNWICFSVSRFINFSSESWQFILFKYFHARTDVLTRARQFLLWNFENFLKFFEVSLRVPHLHTPWNKQNGIRTFLFVIFYLFQFFNVEGLCYISDRQIRARPYMGRVPPFFDVTHFLKFSFLCNRKLSQTTQKKKKSWKRPVGKPKKGSPNTSRSTRITPRSFLRFPAILSFLTLIWKSAWRRRSMKTGCDRSWSATRETASFGKDRFTGVIAKFCKSLTLVFFSKKCSLVGYQVDFKLAI